MIMTFTNRLLLTSLLAMGGAGAWAEIPEGYYDACEGLTKSALKSQLYTIVKNHTAISYSKGTWAAFKYTDVHDGDYWWDMYTDDQVPVTSTSGMNVEHSFPKSWWGGTKNDAYKDIVHLVPANANANNLRSNHPFAEVGTELSYKQSVPSPRFKYGTPKAGQAEGYAKCFEPDDEYKGDFARIYFYMVTCYQNLTWAGNGPLTAEQGTYPTLKPWAIEMLLRWHRMDPVSQKELDRNEGIWSQQNNRNPFVDHPEMVEYIWGDKMGEGWSASGSTGPVNPPVDPDPDPDPDPDTDYGLLTSPLAGDTYLFEGVHPGETMLLEIPVLGKDLTRALTASISGVGADMFSLKVGSLSLPAVNINASDIVDENGYALKVVYAPTAETEADGWDLATLTLSGQDLKEPVTVTLQGSCVAKVELSAITVLPVEDVTPEEYTLTWLPAGVEVDGYTVTRRIFEADGTTLYDLLEYDLEGDQTSLTVTDRDPQRREALSVTATLGGETSPASNEVIVEAATESVEGITADPSCEVRYFDAAGYELPGRPTVPGVYLVRIGNLSSKTIVR